MTRRDPYSWTVVRLPERDLAELLGGKRGLALRNGTPRPTSQIRLRNRAQVGADSFASIPPTPSVLA